MKIRVSEKAPGFSACKGKGKSIGRISLPAERFFADMTEDFAERVSSVDLGRMMNVNCFDGMPALNPD